MGRAIRIIAGDAAVTAELNDTWGDEIYFGIGIRPEAEAAMVVALGDLAYWPPGSAFCIFFGSTPMSHGDEIRPASPVTVIGRVLGDATVFKKVPAGTMVRLERQDRGA